MIFLCFIVLFTSIEKISKELVPCLYSDRKVKVWVYFKDKGIKNKKSVLLELEKNLPKKVRERRAKTGNPIVDERDIPVNEDYIKVLHEYGVQIETKSKWLNAVSGYVNGNLISKIAELTFVKKITPVRVFVRKVMKTWRVKSLYGESESYQYRVISSMKKLHEEGYNGTGVVIGVMDVGFYLQHDCISALKYKVLGKKNFVYVQSEYDTSWDDIVPEPWGTKSFHGDRMLAIIAGQDAYDVIGPAYNAYFVLAKTEYVVSERIEEPEDWWISAAEWMEGLELQDASGNSYAVSIISSSLGYKDSLEDTNGILHNYPYSWMTGDSIPISKVASTLADKGVLLVTPMGNIPYTERPDTCIVAPADAKGVLSVGAVDTTGKWTWYTDIWGDVHGSAIGPTYDVRMGLSNRVKPEVVGSWFAYTIDSATSSTGYTISQGTSCATAFIAGICAAILQGHPDWGPAKLLEALTKTASNSDAPNDTIGYGIPDPYKALYYEPPIKGNYPLSAFIVNVYPNPLRLDRGSRLMITYWLPASTYYNRIRIYTITGRLVYDVKYDETNHFENCGAGKHIIYWDGKDITGDEVPTGVYIIHMRTGLGDSFAKFSVIK